MFATFFQDMLSRCLKAKTQQTIRNMSEIVCYVRLAIHAEWMESDFECGLVSGEGERLFYSPPPGTWSREQRRSACRGHQMSSIRSLVARPSTIGDNEVLVVVRLFVVILLRQLFYFLLLLL